MVHTDQREKGNAYRERDRLHIQNDYSFILDYDAKWYTQKREREISPPSLHSCILKIITRNYQLVYYDAKLSASKLCRAKESELQGYCRIQKFVFQNETCPCVANSKSQARNLNIKCRSFSRDSSNFLDLVLFFSYVKSFLILICFVGRVPFLLQSTKYFFMKQTFLKIQ